MTREARVTGIWIVAPGERLQLIARQFVPHDVAAQNRLRNYLFEHNPHAFFKGDPDRLIPGARLQLPPAITAQGAPAAQPKPSAAAKEGPAVASPAAASAPPEPAAVPAAPEFAVGPPVQAKRAAPEAKPYVDQLIEGAGETEAAIPVDEAAMAPGQRYFSAEYRMEARYPPGGGHGLEQGVNLGLRRETLNYGDFYLEGALRDTTLAPGESDIGRRNGGRFTLYQERFPLAEGWLADSAFGVVRTPPSALVNSSYRIFLPTSLMAGASTVVSDGKQDMLMYAGHVGRLEGSAIQSFDPTSGNLAGLGYTRRVGPWSVGGQAIGLRGNSQVPDHEAATLAAEYGSFGDLVHNKAQIAADNDANLGAWFDGDMTSGRLRQRFGLYSLDPDLKWGDGSLANDQRGAYWRGDYRMLRYTLSGGLEAAQTNIRDNPAKTATRSGTAYGTFSLRIDRDLTVGGGLTYQGTRNRFTASPRGAALSATAYASWDTRLGLSRLDFTSFRGTATDIPDNTIDTISWSQDWPAWEYLRLTSTMNFARENSLGARTDRASLGLSAHGTLASEGLWDASVVYGRIDGVGGVSDNVNVSGTATWPFARNWAALAQLSINTFDVLPAIPGTETTPTLLHDKRLLVGVRYEQSSGTPYQALGLRGGAGSGHLTGVVFFDENGDGVRQPTERGAANVTVYLDGRFPATTDAQGRFSFAVVTPGSHGLRILNEALPLPWSLDDDRPLVANVPLRGDASVEIPLKKIRP